MNKKQLIILGFVAVIAGLVGGLMSGPTASAVPSMLQGQQFKAIQRSSTQAALFGEQRGAGAVLELKKPTGTTSPLDITLGQPARFNKLLIVPFGTNAGIVTMTPSPTVTPSPTLTPTPTRTLTPTP